MHHRRFKASGRRLSSRDIFDSEQSLSSVEQARRSFGTFLQNQSSHSVSEKRRSPPIAIAEQNRSLSDKVVELDKARDAKALLAQLKLFEQAFNVVMNFHKMRLKCREDDKMKRAYEVIKKETKRMKDLLQSEIDQIEENKCEKISSSLQVISIRSSSSK